MKLFLAILLTGILTENFVLSKIPRHLPLPRRIQKAQYSRGYERGGHFVMVLSTAVTYPINQFLLVKNGLEYFANARLHPRHRGARTAGGIALKKFLPRFTIPLAFICR